MWTRAHKCNRIISPLHLLPGIPRLPQTMVDAFVTQESCSLFPLLPAFNPSVPSVSLALSNRVSPAEYGCIFSFPSWWKKHKIKPIKSFCDKGFTPASQWLCLSASVLFVSVFCSTAEILCNSPCLVCEWLVYIFPETHVFDPHTFYKKQANQLPSLFTLKLVSFYPLGSTLSATQHHGTLYLVQTTKPVVTQEQNLVVLIHIGLPVVSAQRAVHWRECLYSSEWCTE